MSEPPRASRPAAGLRLIAELGRGGMGTAYLCVAPGPGGFRKLKVVKRLRRELANDPEVVRMFLDEAKLLARLSHPNVVHTNEVGFDGRHHYIEMEYVEGQTLDALVREASSSLPIAVHLWILTQILAGLDYAHDLTDAAGEPLSIVHRDVSPHNVILSYDGAVTIVDFGIAKAADSRIETRTGVVKGKLTYMAPEQAAQEPLPRAVDRRADVFAVGVMAWQAVTGQRLWAGVGDAEIMARLVRGEVPSLEGAKADAPPELVAICARALAIDPRDRYATAGEMQLALEAYLDGVKPRAGARDLAAIMRRLFSEQRAQVRAEIDAQLREIDAGARDPVDLPVLGHLGAATTTGGAATETSSTRLTHGTSIAPDGPAQTAPGAPRWRRSAAWIAGLTGALALTAWSLERPRTRAATASGDGIRAGCETRADCAASGDAAVICRKDLHRCVALETDKCKVHAQPDEIGNDATIWLGAMFPLSGPEAEAFGRTNANAADLARRDFASVSGGLPPAGGGGPPRPIGLVVCDDTREAAEVAKHLVEDVGVPAIIGFHRSEEVIELAHSEFLPRGVMAVAALNSSPMLTSIPHPKGMPRMVWRTNVSSAQWALPVAHVVSDVFEPRLAPTLHEPLRVAFVRTNANSAIGFADTLFGELRFNGKAAVANGESYREFVYDDAGAGKAPDYASIVKGLAAFAPHVIVYFADAFVESVLAPLEEAWPRAAPHRPLYATTGVLGDPALHRFVGKSAERRRRILSADLPAAFAANARFAVRYNEVFTPKVTLNDAPGVAYDAFYLLAYAAYATEERPLTGTALARSMKRLVPPGAPIDVGPAKIFEAFSALGEGRSIDLQGAATRLDFDLATGESPADFVILCPRVDAEGAMIGAVESGLAYQPVKKVLEGTLRCP